MRWSFCYNSDGKCCYAEAVQNNGCVVQISKYMDAECIDKAMAEQKSRVDTDYFGRSRFIAALDLYHLTKSKLTREISADLNKDLQSLALISGLRSRTLFQ